MNHPLDQPVWNALTSVHQKHCRPIGDFKFYEPEYCPFGATTGPVNVPKGLDDYPQQSGEFYIVGGNTPPEITGLSMIRNLVCNQMIATGPASCISDDIVPLTASHTRELSNLVNHVQPGYFREKTADLGNYYGIFHQGTLVAVAGERMQLADYTEISAVVTHPDFTERGYAARLVIFATHQITTHGKTPFLHVATTNTRAIALYERCGFVTRKHINFYQYKTL